MNSVKQVMAALKKLGTAQTRKTYIRHGAPADKLFGVKIGDMKPILKKIKGNQELAFGLYETDNVDAQYLAGLAVDGSQMTKKELEGWLKGAASGGICQYTVPSVVVESKHAHGLAVKWMKSRKAEVAVAGWCTMVGIVSTREDSELDMAELRGYLKQVVAEIHGAPNDVKTVMNQYVISVGGYVKPLLKAAKATAKKVGKVEVDHGDTSCKTPDALSTIEKIEKMGRVGKKRKTMKC